MNEKIRYGSVCSGIEAATAAWHKLGWEPAWFAEIDKAPSLVLAYRHPNVPNYGDMTLLARRVLAGEIEAPDVLVGGTPCQAYSLAGLRAGLNDKRGQLTLRYMELANAIDYVRARLGKPPCVIVWENVPGVLSDKTNAFGCFLAGLAGEDVELQPPGRRWTNAGAVYGPQRAAAWRTLDAQYFGLAQRRRRVFVVSSAREGFDPATILFEFDGGRRDTAPSRQPGQDAAAGTLRSSDGGLDLDQARVGHLQPVAGTILANGKAAGSATQQDAESGLLVVVAFGGNNTSGEIQVAPGLNCNGGSRSGDFEAGALLVQPIAFSCKDHGADATTDLAPTMRAMGHAGSHANAGGQLAVCVTGDITHTLKAEGFDASEDGTGRGQPIVAHAIAGALCANTYSGGMGGRVDMAMQGYAQPTGMAVRRLMPIECERLQGFPDGHTLVPTGKIKPARAKALQAKGEPALCIDGQWWKMMADGPRYKCLGNSMAVPVMYWIGNKIDQRIGARAGRALLRA